MDDRQLIDMKNAKSDIGRLVKVEWVREKKGTSKEMATLA
jgi:hypothetical protein